MKRRERPKRQDAETRRAPLRIVLAARLICPHCGGFRSKIIVTRPDPEVERRRMVQRRCLSCLQDFLVIES
jgi:hypothetical protein